MIYTFSSLYADFLKGWGISTQSVQEVPLNIANKSDFDNMVRVEVSHKKLKVNTTNWGYEFKVLTNKYTMRGERKGQPPY